jgi:hypothetical protein
VVEPPADSVAGEVAVGAGSLAAQPVSTRALAPATAISFASFDIDYLS